MSRGSRRYPLNHAEMLGEGLAAMLNNHVGTAVVAGSVRRKQPDVGDIEIVCRAAKYASQPGLFGDGVTDRTKLDDVIADGGPLILAGWHVGRKNGPVHKEFEHNTSGIRADVYLVIDERAWGSTLTVRTGPWYFAKSLMNRARQLSMRFSDGFLLHDHLHVCTSGPDCPKIIPLPDEGEVFKHLRIVWLEPEQRIAGLRAKD